MSTTDTERTRHEHAIEHELVHSGALLMGEHFVLKSGRHAETYINCDCLYSQPKRLTPIFGHWQLRWFDRRVGGEVPDVVAAPATGGVYLVAGFRYFTENQRLATVWADKTDEGFVLERAGFVEAVQDRNVLVLEDVITSGGSVVGTIEAVRAAGGNVLGVACIVNRRLSTTAESLGVPVLTTGVQRDDQDWAYDALPTRIAERPIVTNIGHGAEFQQVYPDYPAGYKEL